MLRLETELEELHHQVVALADAEQDEWRSGMLEGLATMLRIWILEDVQELKQWLRRAEEALGAAKSGLVGSLHHGFDSCNRGMEEACFVCEGLYAVGRARDEPWTRVEGRTNVW